MFLRVRHGADVNHQEPDGMTPLMFAVQKGDLSMTTLLLEKNALVDTRDSQKKNALFHAIEKSSSENDDVISKLLERISPSEIDAEDIEKKTVLARAYEKGYTKTVRQLLDLYASPNVAIDVEQGEPS